MARSVPLSWFTSRVGGGSAFYVRRLARSIILMKQPRIILLSIIAVSAALVGLYWESGRSHAYQMGLTEGRRHVRERPETSLMVFPAESTNWSKPYLELYRSGYLAGLGGN